MNIFLSPFAPEKLVSRDGFGRTVPLQPSHLHTQAESGAYLRDSSISAAASIYFYKLLPGIGHRASRELIGSRNCVPMAFTAESPPAQGQ